MPKSTTCRLPRCMLTAGMAYLDYLRFDCSIDLNSYLDEDVLETLFFKMLAEHLAASEPQHSECGSIPDRVLG